MELEAGFKNTEFGVIPEDWEEKSIFELADNKKALFDDGDWIEAEHITSEGIRLIQTGNIGIGKYVEKEDKKYIYEQSFIKLKCKVLHVGDLLICRLAEPAGRACIFPNINEERVVTSVDVTIYRPIVNVANRLFLKNIFSTKEWFDKINENVGGTTHKRISRSALGRIKIPLPPLPEQTAIATVLSDTDKLIQALEKKIAKKQLIKKGAMQKLLTPKEGWEVKTLGEVLRVKHGKDQKSIVDKNGKYPILGTGGLMGFTNHFVYDKPSVLIGRKGTIDKPQYMDLPFWTVDTLFYTEILKGYSAKYLFYLFNLIDWYSYNEASGVPSLNANTIERIEISVPSFNEQLLIVQILTDMDTEIDLLEKETGKIQAAQAGLNAKFINW